VAVVHGEFSAFGAGNSRSAFSFRAINVFISVALNFRTFGSIRELRGIVNRHFYAFLSPWSPGFL
jgi:hypothetical protein